MSPARIFFITLTVIYSIDFLLIISLIFLEKKDVRSIFPWLLSFLFIPVFSWVLYTFIGKGPKFNRRKWSKRKRLADRAVEKQFLEGRLNRYSALDPEINALIHLNESNNLPCTVYNDAKLYTDAHDMYRDQLSDMEKAEYSINVMYYLFKPDEAGKSFLELMTKKARQGLKVILVFDDSANPKTNKHFLKDFIKAGGIVQPFFPSKISFLINNNFAYRNHRKIVVIDGKIGYIGGMNIGVDYLSQDKKITPWRDTHIRLVGEAVALLQTRFLQDYSCSSKGHIKSELKTLGDTAAVYYPIPTKSSFGPVQIISSGPDSSSEEIKQAYLKMISIARNTLYLETPYFIPDRSFIDALIIAKKSGVDVRLVIPGVPDKKSVYHVTYSYLEEILLAGIRVYLYLGFIHSKMIVSDDRVASIGTANLDVRSFNLNFEVNALLYERKIINEAINAANSDIAKSKELTLQEYQKRGFLKKIKENFFRLFSPLM